jgi:ribosomal protein S18 acetylase RimI-like enzyme
MVAASGVVLAGVWLVTAFVVRPFTIDDTEDVLELLGSAGWEGRGLPQRFVLADASRCGAAFVAVERENPKPVGFARVISDRGTVSYLSELVTAVEWRHKGVARVLIDACIDRFPLARLDVLSTDAALGFYEGTGFVPRRGFRRWPL